MTQVRHGMAISWTKNCKLVSGIKQYNRGHVGEEQGSKMPLAM